MYAIKDIYTTSVSHKARSILDRHTNTHLQSYCIINRPMTIKLKLHVLKIL